MDRRRLLGSLATLAAGSSVALGAFYRSNQYEVTATAERFDFGLRFNDLGTDESRPTADIDEFPASVRPKLREAALVPGVAGVNDLPESAAERLREADLLRVDGRYYTTYVSDVRDVPLRVEATVVESSRAPFDPAAFELAVRNEGEETLELSAGPPMPFGVVSAHRPGDYERRVTLWSDDYRDARAVTTVGHRVVSVLGLGMGMDLRPGATASTVYELGRGGPGRWVVDGDVGVPGDGDGSEGHDGGDFPYRVRIHVRARA
jgi:hypothetical protein